MAAYASKLSHIPTLTVYHEDMGIVKKDGTAIFKYLNINQIKDYVENTKDETA